jgi:quercetin 2,3-dioxygenase
MNMTKNLITTIYPGEHRFLEETGKFRRYSTFDANDKFLVRREFGALLQVNDVTLAPLESLQVTANFDMCIVLVPTVGVIECWNVVKELVFTGNACRYMMSEGEELKVKNPLADRLVTYLQFNFKAGSVDFSDHLFAIEPLEKNKNKLVELFSTPDISSEQSNSIARIGMYDGRAKDTFLPAGGKNYIFVLILQGAFEVEDRLLEASDGLGIYDCRSMEFEALSNDAIILLIEMQSS